MKQLLTFLFCASDYLKIDLSSLFPFESTVKPVLIVTVITTQHGQHVVVLLSTYKMLHPLQRFQCVFQLKKHFNVFLVD